jgi:hypothetical protein
MRSIPKEYGSIENYHKSLKDEIQKPPDPDNDLLDPSDPDDKSHYEGNDPDRPIIPEKKPDKAAGA